MLKEWTSIKGKDVFWLIDAKGVPNNVDLIPAQWTYKMKNNGRYKSRLCACGNCAHAKGWQFRGPTMLLHRVSVRSECCSLIGIRATTNAAQLAGLYLWVLHLFHGLLAFNDTQLAAQHRVNTFPLAHWHKNACT